MPGKLPLVVYSNENPQFKALYEDASQKLDLSYDLSFLSPDTYLADVIHKASLVLLEIDPENVPRMEELESEEIQEQLQEIPVLILDAGLAKINMSLGKKLKALAIFNQPEDLPAMKLLLSLINKILRMD